MDIYACRKPSLNRSVPAGQPSNTVIVECQYRGLSALETVLKVFRDNDILWVKNFTKSSEKHPEFLKELLADISRADSREMADIQRALQKIFPKDGS